MSGRFLYFVSGDDRPVSHERLQSWGLGYVIENGVGIENRQCSGGPNGERGAVFAQDGARDTGVYLDRQSWRKMPRREGRPEIWIGYWNESKPTPQTLARKKMLATELGIRLADGNLWFIPAVRHYDESAAHWDCLLPSRLDFDEDGKLHPVEPLAAYKHLWEITSPVANALVVRGEDVEPVTDQQVQDAAIALLQANYVVDVPELAVLGALSTAESFASIVTAACRGKELLEWMDSLQKKSGSQSAESGSHTSDGEAA